MDLKTFDDPQPVAPTDAARARVRTHGNQLRTRRRLVLSAPVVLVAAAAIAIPLAVTTSNNRSDIQRIEPITPPTPPASTVKPAIPPTSTPPNPSPAVTASLAAGVGPDLQPHPYTTADGTTIYPVGNQGTGHGTTTVFWNVVAGSGGFDLKVGDFQGTFNAQPACQPYGPQQQDERLAAGQKVTWELECRDGPGTQQMIYEPNGVPVAVWTYTWPPGFDPGPLPTPTSS